MSAHVITMNIENITHKTNETLSSRLLCALERLKISQSELARLIGVKPQIIQYLCTSNANKSKFAYEIAIALGVNPSWLIAGKGPMIDLATGNYPLATQPKVPLLKWTEIINWLTKLNPIQHSDLEYIFVNNEPTMSSYALKVFDTSMVPRFEPGTILIIDPTLKPNNGDFVIALISHQQQAIVRQFIYKNKQHYLSPMNSTIYKEIELTSEDKILGVIKQTYFEFTR